MNKEDCEGVLKRIRNQQEYFEDIFYPLIAAEFKKAADCIEYLLGEKCEKHEES